MEEQLQWNGEKDSYQTGVKICSTKDRFSKALSTDETIKTEFCADMSEVPDENIFDVEYVEENA